jgi:hypothetical protein
MKKENKTSVAWVIMPFVSIASIIAGAAGNQSHHNKKHADDRISFDVSYQNMPSVGPIGTTIGISASIGRKYLRIRDLPSLVDRFDPKKAPHTENELRQYESDIADQFLRDNLSTSETFTKNKETGEFESTLRGMDYDVTASYHDEGGELGNWEGNSFRITPRR